MMDAVLNGYGNPDLRNLKAAGGKLMIIQGWEDSGFERATSHRRLL